MSKRKDAYVIRQCTNPLCRFRFPAPTLEGLGQQCPKCEDQTAIAVPEPQSADFTRRSEERPTGQLAHLEALLDNTRSIYNVGSIFRTADGAGLRHLYLCGITATPEHPKLAKTALGADDTLGWNYARNGVDQVRALKEKGYQLWALEETPQAQNLFEIDPLPADHSPVVLVLGNEVTGVDPGILDYCDRSVVIPMVGTKKSLNVTIAFGTAAYHLLHGRKSP